MKRRSGNGIPAKVAEMYKAASADEAHRYCECGPAGTVRWIRGIASHTPLLNHWLTSRIIFMGAMTSGRIVATPVRLLMFVVDVLPERMVSGLPD